jgi:hypothetical protein
MRMNLRTGIAPMQEGRGIIGRGIENQTIIPLPIIPLSEFEKSFQNDAALEMALRGTRRNAEKMTFRSAKFRVLRAAALKFLATHFYAPQ